jgi:transcriptional regulator with XRE-family HTH domain
MKQTREDFTLARGLLGMTAPQMAKALRMGKGSDRTIRRYESGECPVPGPTSVAVEALLTGFRPEGFTETK